MKVAPEAAVRCLSVGPITIVSQGRPRVEPEVEPEVEEPFPVIGALNPDLTYGSVADIEGNVYATIQIGSQIWMAQNLKTSRYSNGGFITTWSRVRSGWLLGQRVTPFMTA